MPIEGEPNTDPTSAAGSDGTDNSGASVKTVPESDLVAVKQSLENKVSEAESKLADATAAQLALKQFKRTPPTTAPYTNTTPAYPPFSPSSP